jgi:hypothetical protein
LGQPIRYPRSHGDCWFSTWADDGTLYVTSDDTQGFDQACNQRGQDPPLGPLTGPSPVREYGSNLAVHRIAGDRPPDIQGQTVNPMRQFGGWAERRPEDGGMWKANGIACVDGVLYLSVSRHGSPFSEVHIQETWDASIVKSSDYGQTWSETPRLGQATFPGHTFSTPNFVQYGQDGRGTADGADEYVYAVSSNGVWNNGSAMTLGRVRRDRIGRLDARDWEFVHGFDRDRRPVWRPRHDTAQYVFRAPGRTGMTGVHHLAPLGLYVLPQWHYTHLDDPVRRWRATCFELYQAPAPWGPWTLFHVQHFEPEGWYNPVIPSKFVDEDGRRLWLFVAGDFLRSRTVDDLYGLWMLPVTLEVES